MFFVALDVEALIQALEAMHRTELLDALRDVPCTFHVDFTDDYLANLTEDRLRHLAFAAYIQAQKHHRAVA